MFFHNFCEYRYFWVFSSNGDICFEFRINNVTNTDFHSRTKPNRRTRIQISTNFNIYILFSLSSEGPEIVNNLFFVFDYMTTTIAITKLTLQGARLPSRSSNSKGADQPSYKADGLKLLFQKKRFCNKNIFKKLCIIVSLFVNKM